MIKKFTNAVDALRFLKYIDVYSSYPPQYFDDTQLINLANELLEGARKKIPAVAEPAPVNFGKMFITMLGLPPQVDEVILKKTDGHWFILEPGTMTGEPLIQYLNKIHHILKEQK